MNSQGINDEQIVRLTSSTINLQPVESSSNDTRSSNKSELDTDNKCEKCLYASSTTHCPICGYALPPFVSKVKKMDKVDGTDADKSEWIKLEFLIYTDNPALDFKYSQQFAISKDGCYTQRIGSSGL
jgi:hypothetical protein